MNATGKDHWHILRATLHNNPLIAGRCLRWPCPAPLPPTPLLHELRNQAARQGLLPLFSLHLFSALALPKKDRPQSDQFSQNSVPFYPGCPEEILHKAHWCCLPILVCQGANAAVTWLMLGRHRKIQGVSFIGIPLPEASSREGANMAMEAIMHHLQSPDCGYLAFTLQHPDDPPLTGGSLALPLALGMLLLDRNRTWPKGAYASGGLSATGRILAVAGEKIKYGMAVNSMTMLIYPDSGLLEEIPDAKVVRCANLEQAIFALDAVQQGVEAAAITQYRACLAKPSLFLHQFKSLPLELLNFASGRKLLAQIQNERHNLLPALANCLAVCHDDPDRAAVIAKLFNPEEIAALVRQDADKAFVAHRWCMARIASANRSGAVCEGQSWIELAQNLEPMVTGDEMADCANHGFVTTRFNRYDFQPEPPADFIVYLGIEEQRYKIDQRDNRALGAMYGTLAQNYGFCGPSCRAQFMDCIRRAEAAFGRKYRWESQRLLAYQIYSLMDSSQYMEATELLNLYLHLPADSTPQQWIDAAQQLWQQPTEHSPFQIALVCRLLAELAKTDTLNPQPDWCRSLASFLPNRLSHPWQLSALNLGRLFFSAGLPEQGTTLLQRCAASCSAGEIATVPMALLPLASLHALDPHNMDVLHACSEILQKIRVSTMLQQTHFQTLVDGLSPAQVLATVWASPYRYFPFSYR